MKVKEVRSDVRRKLINGLKLAKKYNPDENCYRYETLQAVHAIEISDDGSYLYAVTWSKVSNLFTAESKLNINLLFC